MADLGNVLFHGLSLCLITVLTVELMLVMVLKAEFFSFGAEFYKISRKYEFSLCAVIINVHGASRDNDNCTSTRNFQKDLID